MESRTPDHDRGGASLGDDRREESPGNDRPDAADDPTGEPVALPITDELDLHTIPARDVPEVVVEYLYEAQRAGLIEVRIVHGKGIGMQREAVARVLADHPAVSSFGLAPAHRGHWGATIVRLRRASGHSRA